RRRSVAVTPWIIPHRTGGRHEPFCLPCPAGSGTVQRRGGRIDDTEDDAMTRLLACVCLAGLALPGPAAEPTLAEARQRWLRGNFEEARTAYRTLLAQEQFRVAAAVGLRRVDEAQRRDDDARKVLAEALSAAPQDADLLARQAELAYTLGRWDEADKAVAAALAVNEDHLLARFVRAQLKRDRGDLDGAYADFRWFVTTYNQRQFKAADDLLVIGRAGIEDARKTALINQLRTILTGVYADALAADPDDWYAEQYAGLLLLEKYNRGEALSAFDKALAINPQAAEALVGKAQAAYQGFEMRDAEQFVEQALKIN